MTITRPRRGIGRRTYSLQVGIIDKIEAAGEAGITRRELIALFPLPSKRRIARILQSLEDENTIEQHVMTLIEMEQRGEEWRPSQFLCRIVPED